MILDNLVTAVYNGGYCDYSIRGTVLWKCKTE